jgi:hypothetical protein
MIHPDKFKHERGVEVSSTSPHPFSWELTTLSFPLFSPSSGLRLAQEGTGHSIANIFTYLHVRWLSSLVLTSQAEGSLSTKESRASLDEIVLFARRTLFKNFSPPLPLTTLDSDPALPSDWRVKVLKEVRDILIDEEVARRKWVLHRRVRGPRERACWAQGFRPNHRAIKMTLANEGLEAQKKDQEMSERKRKKEADKNWEGTSSTSLFGRFSQSQSEEI